MRTNKTIANLGLALNLLAMLFFKGAYIAKAEININIPKCSDCNIILISVDTLRADHLGCYGYARNTSPNIDKFAEESLVFRRNFVPMSTTLPSHVSMITGLNPQSHKILENRQKIDDSLITLPEILKENGYLTAGIVSTFILAPQFNFNQGFDYYSPTKGDVLATDAAYLYERTSAWLSEHYKKKFFLFLHFMDPHGPYEPPENYYKWGKKWVARYDAEILYVDDIIGKLFKLFKEKGLFDKSLVIFTSDHGQSLGERDYWSHSRSLYDNCIHAPLIVRFPKIKQHYKIDYLTSVIDLMPTILNYLGIEAKIEVEGVDLFGEEILKRKYVFSQRQHYKGQGGDKSKRKLEPSDSFEFGDKYTVRSKEWKYILLTRYSDELYNVKDDPHEENSLIDNENLMEIKKQLKKLIIKWRENASNKAITHSEVVDKETLEKLKALGYVN